MFVKQFLEWMRVKQRIDSSDHTLPFISEGELWWCSIGENIGVEISGKGFTFSRPVIVLKQLGRLSFYGIPTTTKPKTGSWYVSFMVNGSREIAVLSQARVFSSKRLGGKIGTLRLDEYEKIKEAFISLFY